MKASLQGKVLGLGGGLLSAPLLFLGGCASPGAPKPPSLHLPALVRDLRAVRSGDAVELQFTAPQETTDGFPLTGDHLSVTACRQEGVAMPCRPLALPEREALLPTRAKSSAPVHLHDLLPEPLRSGSARLIFYRVEVRNALGKSAGPSAPARVPAGATPPPVQGFSAQGVRTGILLQWAASAGAGEVLLKREQLDGPMQAPAGKTPRQGTADKKGELGRQVTLPAPPATEATPGVVWLQADPGNTALTRTIDGTVAEGIRYRYTAVRRVEVHTGVQPLELRSAPSVPVELAWTDVYPPAMPTELTAVGFGGPEPGRANQPESPPSGVPGFAVDLVWQPVSDERVTGYLVWRVTLRANQEESRVQLTPAPVNVPAFHDASAEATASYRYEVAAVDGRGNRSASATAVVQAARP